MNEDRPQLFAAENVHTYTYKAEPVEQVPRAAAKKTGKCFACQAAVECTAKTFTKCKQCGTKIDVKTLDTEAYRKVMTRDFQKYGLFYSVSRVAKYGEEPFGLQVWKKNRLMNYVIDCYRPYREDWVKVINDGLEDMENEAADRGTFIHGWIQKVLEGPVTLPDDPVVQRCTAEVVQWLMENGITETWSERCVASPELGLAGTIDLVGNRGIMIADFKTKQNSDTFRAIKDGRSGYIWSGIKQLCCYAEILGGVKRMYVVPIDVNTGETLWYEVSPKEREAGTKAVLAAAEALFADHQYDPREVYKQGRCKSLEEIMRVN